MALFPVLVLTIFESFWNPKLGNGCNDGWAGLNKHAVWHRAPSAEDGSYDCCTAIDGEALGMHF